MGGHIQSPAQRANAAAMQAAVEWRVTGSPARSGNAAGRTVTTDPERDCGSGRQGGVAEGAREDLGHALAARLVREERHLGRRAPDSQDRGRQDRGR